MTEAEIRLKFAAIDGALGAMNKMKVSSNPEKLEAQQLIVIGAALDLAAQFFVDWHRIAEAAEAIANRR